MDYSKTVSPVIRDALRELLRSATRRTLTEQEKQMGLAMIDELEHRGKLGHLG